MAAPKILVVDDEPAIRRTLRDILEFEKYKVFEATDGLDCLNKIKGESFDLVIMDVNMPKMTGLEALEKIQEIAPDLPVVVISGQGTLDTALEAVRKGAFDFMPKPPDLNRLFIIIRNALDKGNLVTETKALKKKVATSKTQEIIGVSAAIERVKTTIDRVAPTDARVLVNGPNGSGKELVARWIHEKSPRKEKPLVEVNCAAIPGELIESELFGHEKGAFTSAVSQHVGKFEQANGGTLFLDEIGDMSHNAQAKVLRALQESKITRVGGKSDIQVDVRVVAATNKDLRREIQLGRFREDLFHRLSVIVIQVPPLNDRREDIPLLVDHFLDGIAQKSNIRKHIREDAMKALQEVNWTGNIRELQNVVNRLFIMSGEEITLNDVNDYVLPNSAMPMKEMESLFAAFPDEEEFMEYMRREYRRFRSN